MRPQNSRYMKIFGIDDMLIGAAIGGLGSFFTNKTNADNVEKTNAQNLQIARETTAANMAEAQRNRDYQERLSNTAYQRTMQDMRDAGLNPILAYQKGGASTPAGGAGTAVASRSEPFKAENVAQNAINTALSLQRSQLENENLKYTADNIQANTAKAHSEENMNKVKLQILGEELSPAQLRKVIAEQDKSVYQSSAGKVARKAGTLAQEAERTVSPILNSAKSAVDVIKPFQSYKTETTRSGSRWNSKGEENHYEDTTFNNRWKGW